MNVSATSVEKKIVQAKFYRIAEKEVSLSYYVIAPEEILHSWRNKRLEWI